MIRGVRHGKRAVSNITSTVILSSVLLVVMIAASYLASDVLSVQMASSEFKAGENLVSTVEREINKLMFKELSSAAIKVSFSATAPGYTKTNHSMSVTFSGSPQKSFSVQVNMFNIDGRQEIGGSFNYSLLGDDSLIALASNGSLARIHLSKPLQWRVSLDYERILCTFTGIANLYNGSGYEPTNTLEVSVIVLEFGEFHPSKNSLILVQNIQIVTDSFTRDGNFSLNVTSPGKNPQEAYLDDLGANPYYSTVVRFHRVYVKISVVESA